MSDQQRREFWVYRASARELLPEFMDYYRRVLSAAGRGTGRWFMRHLVVDAVLPAVTVLILLAIQGVPRTNTEWLIMLAPFLAVGGAVVAVALFNLILTPFRWDHMSREFIERWEPREVDASVGTEPFFCGLPSGRYLIIPRLTLINRDQDHDVNLDLSVRLKVRNFEHGLMLSPDVVEPEGLSEKMDARRAGGSFLGNAATVPKEGRIFGYLAAPFLFNAAGLEVVDIHAVESISLGLSDPVHQRAIYSDLLVWPRDVAVRAAARP